MRFIRKIDAAKQVGWHPSHLMRMSRAGKFPKPVKIGANSVGFVEDEVEEWMRSRVAERDDSQGPGEEQ
ncbi:MAG TPA: AlpA family phage regulatory protein [Hyphomicrobiaceae bacterium]|nr:AlpA family phage regulatory protein [Hyphomicrobiaceae bacterium]